MSSIVSVGAVVEAVLPPLEAAVAAVAAVAIDEGAPPLLAETLPLAGI